MKEKNRPAVKEQIAKLFKTKIGKTVFLSAVIAVIVIVIFCAFGAKRSLDTTYIIARLEKSSELTTAKLHYTGFSEFKDSGIALINRSDFIMVYEATARAGIDVKEIEVEADDLNKVVWIMLPEAKILDVKVDMDNIKYFDEKFSLFNVDSKEDANKANALAEQAAMEELADMGILEMANEQAEALIKGLIEDLVPNGYKITVKKVSSQ